MKKLLLLLLAAVVVGIVLSRKTEPEGEPEKGEKDKAPKTALAERPPPRQDETLAQAPPAEAVPLSTRASAPDAGQEQPSAEPAEKPEPALDPSSPEEPDPLKQVGTLLEKGDRVGARSLLTDLYLEATGERAEKLQRLLDGINADLVFNPRCIEGAQIHVVQPGETLTKIARQYDVNWRMLARINGMSPDGLLRAGQQLKVLPGKTYIVAWKSGFRLALLVDGYYVKEYPIGIGKNGRTPVGEFTVDSMLVEPRWYAPGGQVIEYGEEGHLLGDRWIGFADEPGAAGLGVHGTTEQSSIGTECSNGCIRLTNEDVTELYDFVQIGTRVQIRD